MKKGKYSKMVYGISNFQHFNTFRPLFQKLLEINVKFKLQTCLTCQDLLTMQF
jgi:mannose-6-phosphate isomerase class I